MELVQGFPHFIGTGIKLFAFTGAVILVFIAIGGLIFLAVLGLTNGIWALIDYAQRRKTLRRAQRDVDEVALGLVADGSQVTGLLEGGDPAEGSNTMDNGAGGRVKTEV